MKRLIIPLVMFSVILLLNSCASPKKIVYFQDVEGVELKDSLLTFEPNIQIGDLLFINVSATDGEAALPFNLYTTPNVGTVSNAEPLNYLVNSDGAINFPVLGALEVSGLTTKQLTEKLEDVLEEYINKPVINVRITNFKVSVLGEITKPGTFEVLNERISVIEALALAGDLTIYGQRESVLLIREVDGKKEFVTIDLTNKKLFDSPYYFLKQNDVIYITPNKTRVNGSRVGPNTSVIFSSISVLMAVIALII